jgi:plastocyanin
MAPVLLYRQCRPAFSAEHTQRKTMSIRLLSGVLSAAVIAVAGCGGGSSPASPSPTPTGGGGGGGGSATTISIVANNGTQSFNPNPASAAQGTTVSWTNGDGATHRLVANDGSFDTGNIAPGATSAPLMLTDDGVNYHCSIHPNMIGSINRSSGGPPPCQGLYCSSAR